MNLLLILLISAVLIFIGLIILALICNFFSKKYGDKIGNIVSGILIGSLILSFAIYGFVSQEPSPSPSIDTRTWGDKPRSEWTNKDMQDYTEWNLKEGQKEWENKKFNE